MSRTVTLALVDAAGNVLGALPPFEVEVPWWSATPDVVAGARDRYGLDVTILRLLDAQRPAQPGGAVTYLAQAEGPAPAAALTPVDETTRAAATAEDPRRAAYARPGGPQASLSWAAIELDRRGRGPLLGRAQQRTWNLSSIWRLDAPGGRLWLKEVPSFFGHEPAVLRWLADRGHGRIVTPLVASDAGRMLLDNVPGDDLYGAGGAVRLGIAQAMHGIQVGADVASLLAIGVPDRRRLLDRLTTVARTAGVDDRRLDDLVDGLERRLQRVASSGLPDTLVHGDLHPGNVLGPPRGSEVIIDWGDCVVGNPALDIVRLVDGLPDDEARLILKSWAGWWQAAVPGSDPLAAVDLLRPVADLYYASIYADFLAAIEPTEHPYHALDVASYVRRAIGIV